MIKVNKVHYSYDSTKILNGLNLLESDPIILGLWGRKGTGETTLMKLLAGHLKPDQGEITLFGFNPYNRNQTSDHLCYMQEEHPFSVIWKVKDALRFGDYYNPNFDMNFTND